MAGHRHDTNGGRDGGTYWLPNNGKEIEYQRYYCSYPSCSMSTPVPTGQTRDRQI